MSLYRPLCYLDRMTDIATSQDRMQEAQDLRQLGLTPAPFDPNYPEHYAGVALGLIATAKSVKVAPGVRMLDVGIPSSVPITDQTKPLASTSHSPQEREWFAARDTQSIHEFAEARSAREFFFPKASRLRREAAERIERNLKRYHEQHRNGTTTRRVLAHQLLMA